MSSAAYGAVLPPSKPQTAAASALPHAYPFSDPKNSIGQPANPQQNFTLAEGTYSLRDEVVLGDVQPAPTDRIAQTNVLDTKLAPPTAGVQLSVASLGPSRPRSAQRRSLNGPTFRSVFSSSRKTDSGGSSKDSSEDASSRSDAYGPPTDVRSKFGEGNTALAPPPTKDSLKRRKPKSNITKGHSSFIARATLHENFSKRLLERQGDGLYALANISRAMYWLDLGSSSKQDQLSKIVFTKAHATCHHLNDYTKTPGHLDYIVGFNTADIMWFEATTQKYSHLNKNGMIHSSPISRILWLPGTENLFIAAHQDGCLTVHDKEKDDAAFTPEEPPLTPPKTTNGGKRLPRLLIKKSVQSRNQKANPVAFWRATNQVINDMAFSPDGTLLALACEDGTLRIIDQSNEELLDLYRSYYGGFTCLAWSPDGEYILTGGQDDLISIWSIEDRALVARCAGHKSWISSVAFDTQRSDDTTYRFGSVGEDGRLLLWDFSVGMLNQPRKATRQTSPSDERKSSIATLTQDMVTSTTDEDEDGEDDDDGITHQILPRAAVAMLPPIMSKAIDEKHVLSWLRFEDDCIMATCKMGHIYTWDRP